MSNKELQEYSKKWFYIACILVFGASFVAARFLPVSELIADIALTPGIGALIVFLVQLWRDERAHERVLELQNKQQDFVLGTASHMADVAYDKHVEFCEEYITRVREGLKELMIEGATKGTMNIGGDLVRIRIKHSAWLTSEIENALKPFEMALINIGAKEHLLESLPTGEQRKKVVDEIYRSFGLVLGHEKSINEDEAAISRENVIEQIRKILGIDILTALRKEAAEIALKRIEKASK